MPPSILCAASVRSVRPVLCAVLRVSIIIPRTPVGEVACGSQWDSCRDGGQQAPVNLAGVFFKQRLHLRKNIFHRAQEGAGIDIIEIVAVAEVFLLQRASVPSSLMLLKKSSIAADSELSSSGH